MECLHAISLKEIHNNVFLGRESAGITNCRVSAANGVTVYNYN